MSGASVGLGREAISIPEDSNVSVVREDSGICVTSDGDCDGQQLRYVDVTDAVNLNSNSKFAVVAGMTSSGQVDEDIDLNPTHLIKEDNKKLTLLVSVQILMDPY